MKKSASICLSVALAVLLIGCGTTPTAPERQTVAYSGNDQTAGILSMEPGGALILDAAGLYRFTCILDKWGASLTPPARKLDAYVTPDAKTGLWRLTREGAEVWFQCKQAAARARIEGAK